MATYRTKIIEDGEHLAVLIPKEIGFGIGVEVVVETVGEEVFIHRASTYDANARKKNALVAPKMTIQELVRRLRELPAPSEIEVRDTEEIPEPKGF
jgi:hypothetical protein